MKKTYVPFLIFFLLLFFSLQSFSQNNCNNNADFEAGSTAGWAGKSGTYGAAVYSGVCPTPAPNYCPTFPTNLTTPGFLNPNGNDALGNTLVDRHTIMTPNFRSWAGAGMGKDSISNNTVSVVAPGGGGYSFRLGDEVAGGVGANPNRLARAESIRLSFFVTPGNAGFTYRYAVFLQDPGHLPEEQPRFEVFVTQPDSNDQLIPCGYYKFVSGSSNPYCSGTRDSSTFKYGSGQWRYTDWTDVGLDLSGYVGQNIAVEFRTSDCFPNQPVIYTSGGVQTSCSNGICYWNLPVPGSTTISTCTNAPGTHSAYAYIDAFCSPILIVNQPVCIGDDSIQVCAPSGYKDWLWSTGETTNCIWVKNYSPNDTFPVQMHSQAGCPTKSTVRLTGTDVLTRDTVFCEGVTGIVDLTATLTVPGTYTYSWTGPPTIGLPSTNLTTPIPIPLATSTYSLSVTDPSAGCVYKKTMTVQIDPKPQVNISPDTSVCLGANVQLSSSGPSILCSWAPPDFLDNQLSCTPVAINPTGTTTYIVTLTDTNGCTNSDTTTITINQAAIAFANAVPSSICLGDTTSLTATTGMSFYQWSPATTSPSASATTATPSITTTYTVAVRNADGCADTATVNVIVNPIPNVWVSPNPSICEGDTTTLTVTGGTFYSWVPGIAAGLDLPNDSITTAHPTAQTTYTVSVSYATGCMKDTIVTIFIDPLPQACVNGMDVCLGQPARLDASCSTPFGILTYAWEPDPTLVPLNVSDPIANPTSTTTYTLVVSTTPNCPTDTTTATVVVHPIPTVTASPDVKIMAGTSTELTASGTGISYTWVPPIVCVSPCLTGMVSPLVTTQYIVTTVDSFGCTSIDTVIVTVDDILTLYVPSAFLPVNYDNHNKVFYAFGVGIWEFDFYIFDRWGTQLFESHDPTIGWDGTYKGSMVQSDVYTWLAKAKSITGKTITKTGPVTIVR